jgi:hypothetical protein
MTNDPGPESLAARSSLVWGIIAMFAWLLPPVGLLVAIAGLIRGRQGWDDPDRDRARLGVVLSVIGLLLTTWLTAWIAVVSTSFPITDFE